jgi:hypothetical protein
VGGEEDKRKIRSEPEEGAAKSSYIGTGAPGPMSQVEKQKCDKSDHESKQQELEESVHEVSECSQTRDVQHCFFSSTFSGLHLQELESIFQPTQYPNVFAG